MVKQIQFILSLAVLMISCKDGSDNGLTIVYRKTFDSIPSASGLTIRGGFAYVVCDDGTGIYQINLRNFHQNKIAIKGFSYDQYREPKPVKHDFESLTLANWNGNEYLIAFGSGSNMAHRDSMLMLSPSNFADQRVISLKDFYERLKGLTNSDSTNWNIEGAATVNNDLFILNRGRNIIIRCDLNEFLSYLLRPNSPFPKIDYNELQLKSINGHEARLSGACAADSNYLLFCASVEDTPDWTKDGPILGSFIGIYSIANRKIIASYPLKSKQGNELKEKIESVDISQRKSNGNWTLVAVGDNDNGTSDLFQLELEQDLKK